MSMTEDMKGEGPPVDLESQAPAGGGGDTMLDGCLRCLDYFHPMGPSYVATNSSTYQVIRRRIASVLLSAVLVAYCGAPFNFTPFSWVIQYDSPHIKTVELIISHVFLAASCYFHFRIASLRSPVVLYVPLLCSRHRMGIRGVRLQQLKPTPTRWYPEMF